MSLLLACASSTEKERTCLPTQGASGAPWNIEEAVALINSLPRPVSVACLVEALERPLYVSATSSASSAQPAQGRRSPRLFFFSGPLIISVVPTGPGATLVEFSQLDAFGRSIKGELSFPVEAEVQPEDPYTHVMFGPDVTSCGFCHRGESAVYKVGSAQVYASQALRPVDASLVPLSELREEANACDRTQEPERCDLLEALFTDGQPRPQSFPETLQTFGT